MMLKNIPCHRVFTLILTYQSNTHIPRILFDDLSTNNDNQLVEITVPRINI
jgi:hypothetical protein